MNLGYLSGLSLKSSELMNETGLIHLNTSSSKGSSFLIVFVGNLTGGCARFLAFLLSFLILFFSVFVLFLRRRTLVVTVIPAAVVVVLVLKVEAAKIEAAVKGRVVVKRFGMDLVVPINVVPRAVIRRDVSIFVN